MYFAFFSETIASGVRKIIYGGPRLRQEFFSGEGTADTVEDRGQRERGSGAVAP
jgi:hypothetical protein